MLLAILISVFGATGVFVWRQTAGEIDARHTGLQATAQIFASVVAPYVAANDRAQALNAIRAISQMPSVPFVLITDINQKQFAALGSAILLSSGNTRSGTTKPGKPSFLSVMKGTSLGVNAKLVNAGRNVGNIFLLADVSDIRARVFEGLIGILVAALAASLFGFAVTNRLKNRITGPLLDLTAAMNRVRESHDFSQSVKRQGNDENRHSS